MRRIFALFLALALVLSLSACRENTPEPTPSPTVEPTPTPKPSVKAEGFLSFLHQPLTEENLKKVCARAAYERLLAGDMSLLEPEKLPLWWHTSLLEGKLEYTYLDLDGDGVEELLLQWINEPGEYNGVFHYAGGRIYCWQHDEVERVCWDHPLRDGTMVTEYHLSGNYSYTLFRYQADGNKKEVTSLCSRSQWADGFGDMTYVVDEREVSQSEFERELTRLVTDQMLDREAWTALPASEPSVEAEGFLSFLNGEAQATVGDDFYNDLVYVGYNNFGHDSAFDYDAWMGSEEMSIYSLKELVENSFSAEDIDAHQMDYVLTKTMGGREMLVIRSQSPIGMDEFWGYFVFGEYDGRLRLTYAEDSWSRSDTELHEGLIFSGGGSAGAGDHYIWCGYIGEDGHYKKVYEAEILDGLWVAMHAYEVFDMGDIDWSSYCVCCLLTTDEGKFYDLDAIEGADLADIDSEELALLRKYYEDQGFTEVDDAGELIAAAETAHGIKDTPVITDWTALELAK